MSACVCAPQRTQDEGLPTRLEPGETFEVVLGCDLLYEPPHAPMLAHAVAARLASHGLAMLLLPIRDWALLHVSVAWHPPFSPSHRHHIAQPLS